MLRLLRLLHRCQLSQVRDELLLHQEADLQVERRDVLSCQCRGLRHRGGRRLASCARAVGAGGRVALLAVARAVVAGLALLLRRVRLRLRAVVAHRLRPRSIRREECGRAGVGELAAR